MLPMSNARHDHSFRRTVATELICNNDARFAPRYRQQLAKKADSRKPIPLRLHENIEDNAVLINRSPEVMSDAVDLEEHLIQMPFITGSSTPPPETVSILFAELIAPAPNRLVGEPHTTCCHHLFHITKADTEPEVQPDAFRNDLSWESVATVRIVRHSSSIASEGARST